MLGGGDAAAGAGRGDDGVGHEPRRDVRLPRAPPRGTAQPTRPPAHPPTDYPTPLSSRRRPFPPPTLTPSYLEFLPATPPPLPREEVLAPRGDFHGASCNTTHTASPPPKKKNRPSPAGTTANRARRVLRGRVLRGERAERPRAQEMGTEATKACAASRPKGAKKGTIEWHKAQASPPPTPLPPPPQFVWGDQESLPHEMLATTASHLPSWERRLDY